MTNGRDWPTNALDEDRREKLNQGPQPRLGLITSGDWVEV